MASDVDVQDGPNDQGEMFDRPGKPYDVIPSPYANKEAGRAANGGAYPPDLSLMVKARHNGADYVFALLTGYCDAPAGKEMMPGLHYNPYFPGGAISMPPPLNDGGVEYEDGTEATISQQARDIAQFLSWTSEPESEDRKKNACKYMVVLAFMALSAGYYKRWKWAPLKTRQIAYVKGVGGAAHQREYDSYIELFVSFFELETTTWSVIVQTEVFEGVLNTVWHPSSKLVIQASR